MQGWYYKYKNEHTFLILNNKCIQLSTYPELKTTVYTQQLNDLIVELKASCHTDVQWKTNQTSEDKTGIMMCDCNRHLLYLLFSFSYIRYTNCELSLGEMIIIKQVQLKAYFHKNKFAFRVGHF